ncbi:FAD-dependent oxidoreductase [Actinomadura mexicana]|uniref:Predicted flavoprotein CzcO associated with the cation diffusion facilitator CzcD n=1 Tax=Actinomadura mexicana TaxID=134959 RepID=A0A239H5W6_9ACTN|nr:FAD-dependent oxidoreductase [Actinomadura mexicana]SNS76561.1 Predicted flavoprotein CzcO associated with the cation diffusion facilitator CzcD [Actinomadura mexicana]
MSESTEAPQPADDDTAGSCCGVSSCCSDTEQSLDPAITVLEAKTAVGCGCVNDQDGAHDLPVVVIGAGPVGLAAAAHLAERGLEFLVLEAGDSVGAAISDWGHVRLFSPWRYDTDAAARRLLEPTGWTLPDPETLPTGAELVRDYLTPLAEVPELAVRIRTGTRVVAVARRGVDVTRTVGRDEQPLLVRTIGPDGTVTDLTARAVIDASGTWGRSNPLGHSGLPAPGEDQAGPYLTGPLPDVLGRDRDRFAGKHTLVVGMGHSAANTLLSLAELAKTAPGTRITWAVRSASVARLYGGGDADGLPARGALGTRLKAAVEGGEIDLVRSFTITGFASPNAGPAAGPVKVIGVTPDGERVIEADALVAATGFRPDLDMLREVRVELDPATEAPVRLAPMIDPNFHSCGTVPPHGERDLAHTETGFYLVGMKSYGRAPTFLMATGYEQVRSVVAALAGDRAAADAVELDLPETGVCSTNLITKDQLPGAAAGDGCGTSCGTEPAEIPAAVTAGETGGGSCCGGSAPEPVTIGIGAPAGLGFATGSVHGYSGETERGDN